jgi:LEA14-like dessication related protein
MYKFFSKKSFLFVFTVLALSACSLIKPVELKGVNSFKIAEKQGVGVQVNTSLKLYNPNKINVTLIGSDIDVYVEENYIGKLVIPHKISIPGKENFDAEFTLTISFANLLSAGKNVLSKIKSGSFKVSFKGQVEAQYRTYIKTFQLNTTQHVNL